MWKLVSIGIFFLLLGMLASMVLETITMHRKNQVRELHIIDKRVSIEPEYSPPDPTLRWPLHLPPEKADF